VHGEPLVQTIGLSLDGPLISIYDSDERLTRGESSIFCRTDSPWILEGELDPLYIKNQRQMVREMKLTCPVLHDRNGTLAMRFGFKKSLPYSVFITRKGVIAGVSTGYDTTKNAGIYEKIRGILEQ
jgi:hypothetical protein